MSAHDNDELIDYEDDIDGAPPHPTNVADTKATESVPGGDDKENRGHVGVHSTGFR
jgi:hypothetical protein